MKLHLPSVLASLGVVALVALLSSQGTLVASGFRIEYMPHPRDMVQVKQGTPYTVPSGKIFVVTALGSGVNTATLIQLFINGSQELAASTPQEGGNQCAGSGYGNALTVKFAPPGLTAPGGSVVSITSSSLQGRAWGYLANQ